MPPKAKGGKKGAAKGGKKGKAKKKVQQIEHDNIDELFPPTDVKYAIEPVELELDPNYEGARYHQVHEHDDIHHIDFHPHPLHLNSMANNQFNLIPNVGLDTATILQQEGTLTQAEKINVYRSANWRYQSEWLLWAQSHKKDLARLDAPHQPYDLTEIDRSSISRCFALLRQAYEPIPLPDSVTNRKRGKSREASRGGSRPGTSGSVASEGPADDNFVDRSLFEGLESVPILSLFRYLEDRGEQFDNGRNGGRADENGFGGGLMSDNTKSTFLKYLIRSTFPSLPNGELSIRRKKKPNFGAIFAEKGSLVPEIACNKIRYQIDRLEKELKILNVREENEEDVDEEMDKLMTKKITLMDDLEELEKPVNLHDACRMGDVDLVSSILEPDNAPQLINCPDELTGELPLTIAIKKGHLHLVRYLIAACRAEVDLIGVGGNTALHEACKCEASKDIIALLLNHGADPCACNSVGETPLHLAARCDDEHTHTVESLIMYGAHVDALTTKGKYTPLMMAAGAGQVETVFSLLEHGANPGLRNASYHTAVMKAASSSHHECVDAIVNFKPGEHAKAHAKTKKHGKGTLRKNTVVKKTKRK